MISYIHNIRPLNLKEKLMIKEARTLKGALKNKTIKGYNKIIMQTEEIYFFSF